MSAAFWVEHGQQFPYAEGFQPKDVADKAALGVLANLGDRRGVKKELEGVDEDIRLEIVQSLAEIIRAAYNETHGEMLNLLREAQSGEYDSSAKAHQDWLGRVDTAIAKAAGDAHG